MTINVSIKTPRGIIANSASLTSTQSNPAISIKNNGASLNQNYLHNLLDVVENNPQDGYSLVYNATIDKYEVKPIIINDVSVDGGTF